MSVEASQSIPPALVAQVESILYAAGEPASISAMATALEMSTQDIELALEELSKQCKSRGVRVQRHGNEAQLVTAPETAERIQKFLGLEAANRLSTAALETLAIIAYKQPITKPQMEMIRGVNCDGVIKTLEMHNLIKELGRAETVGHPMRYGISFEFLEHFGLRDVHELPPVDKLEVLPSGDDASAPDSPSEPVAQLAGPDQNIAPTGDQAAIVTEPTAQADQESTPENADAAPAQEPPANTPVEDQAAPTEEQPGNLDPTSAPANDQVAPIEEQPGNASPAPASEEPALTEDLPAITEQDPASTGEQGAPIEEKPGDIDQSPAPISEQEASAEKPPDTGANEPATDAPPASSGESA
jgi:segregation and condensation protein B